MCIIVICEKKAPTLSFLQQCARENPHGGGIAWREDGKVHFSKGLHMTAEKIFELSKTVKLPYAIHFRITSSGSTTPELCHPLPIGGKLDLTGSVDDGVLFHNGTWKEWQAILYRTFPTPLPNGEWNDSRTMAYVTKLWGNNWLRLPAMYNRICLFTPKKIILFGSWVEKYGYRLSREMDTDRAVRQYAQTTQQQLPVVYANGANQGMPWVTRTPIATRPDPTVACAGEEPCGEPDPDYEDQQALAEWLAANAGATDSED